MNRFTALISALAILLAAAPSPPEAREALESAAPLSQWHKGPVRYLMSKKETKHFRSLRSDADRSIFISNFWDARDPDPLTLQNEARLEYWERVAETETLFRDTTRPGWKTDRGRIHILLGPPNDTFKDLNFKVSTDDGDFRGLLRWTYHGKLATGRSEPTFIVAYYVDDSGAWRLTHDAQLNSVTFDPLSAIDRPGGGPLIAQVQSRVASAASDLGVALDLGRIVTPAIRDDALIDSVLTEEYYGRVAFASRWDFYPASEAGSALAVVTAFVPRDEVQRVGTGEISRPVLVARLVSADGPAVNIPEGSFVAAPENAASSGSTVLVYQARKTVPPGTWTASVGCVDPVTFRAGSTMSTVEVPEFSADRASISSLTPAARLDPVTREGDRGYHLPFILGELRVMPLAKPAFSTGGDFSVYFQISLPEGAEAARLHLRFFRLDGERVLPVGKARIIEAPQAVQGWSFPLELWPEGGYRLVVELTDTAGGTARRDLEFEVIAGAELPVSQD